MNFLKNTLSIILIVSVLSGCTVLPGMPKISAKNHAEIMEMQQNPEYCCELFEDIDYITLSVSPYKYMGVGFSDEDYLFDFSKGLKPQEIEDFGGDSYFLAYELEGLDDGQQYELEIHSKQLEIGEWDRLNAYYNAYFAPYVIGLDVDYKEVMQREKIEFIPRYQNPYIYGEFKGTISLNPDVRYIIIYSPKKEHWAENTEATHIRRASTTRSPVMREVALGTGGLAGAALFDFGQSAQSRINVWGVLHVPVGWVGVRIQPVDQ